MAEQEFCRYNSCVSNLTNNSSIELKKLSNLHQSNLDYLLGVLEICREYFLSEPAGRVKGLTRINLYVESISGNNFYLTSSDELLKKEDILKKSLMASDFVSFIEQIRDEVWLRSTLEKRKILDNLGSDLFSMLGVGRKTDSSHIQLKTLQALEKNVKSWDRAVNIIDQISQLIKVEDQTSTGIAQEQQAQDKQKIVEEDDQQTSKKRSKASTKKEQEEGLEEQTPTPPARSSSSFNLARLDDQSKLYVRSLALISVNQALQLQFSNLSPEQLSAMGFTAIPTFDQLPLATRQQLLDIAFGKISNNLAGGNLEKLFNNPAQRLVLAKNSALDILTDIRGGQIFATELGKLTQSQISASERQEQLNTNQQQTLAQKQLADKLKISPEQVPEALAKQVNQLSLADAQQFFAQLDSNPQLRQALLKSSQQTFRLLNDQQFLDQWQRFADKTQVMLAEQNILPVIDTFIQQNYPVTFVDKFDWQHFKTYFGEQVLREQSFNSNQPAIKELLKHYWLSHRAVWSQKIHRGINQEFYTAEQMDELFNQMTRPLDDKEAHTKAGKDLLRKRAIYREQHDRQTKLNRLDADAVTKLLAGIQAEQVALDAFNQEQQTLLLNIQTNYRQQLLQEINQQLYLQQATLAYYNQLQNIQLSEQMALNAQSLGFSPYDWGAINYNQLIGPNDQGQFALQQYQNANGSLSSQLQTGVAAAQNLYQNTAGRAIDFLGEKGVELGLDYLTGGAFAALPQPVKDAINKIAWSKAKEIFEKLKPIIMALLALLASLFATIIGLLAKLPGLKAISRSVSGTVGGKNILEGGAISRGIPEGSQAALANESSQQLAAKQQALERAPVTQGAETTIAQKGLLANLGQSAMATAGQAVLITFGLVAGGTLLYQTLISSAFLTQFPTSQYGSGGSAVFCNGVNVGTLTYYSQKDPSLTSIKFTGPGSCVGKSFGGSACGPTSIAMLLNQDPLQLSLNEGYVGANGDPGKTTCNGTGADYLIETLKNYNLNPTLVPAPTGSPGQITDEIARYLSEGNLLFVLTHTRGFGHYYIVTCIESPGQITAYDPAWGQNVIHQVSNNENDGLTDGSNYTYIRNMWLIKR